MNSNCVHMFTVQMHNHEKRKDKQMFLIKLHKMTAKCRSNPENWKKTMETILPWFCLWHKKTNL